MKTEIKIKQFFTLLIISAVAFFGLCLTGCGGKDQSCEGFSCESKTKYAGSFAGCSGPGCGGLLSSGNGWRFDTCGLWSQRIIGLAGYEVVKNNQKTFMVACDNQYYQTEGCSRSKPKSCYALATAGGGNWLVAAGKPDSELWIGTANGSFGCGACFGSGPGSTLITGAELIIFTDF